MKTEVTMALMALSLLNFVPTANASSMGETKIKACDCYLSAQNPRSVNYSRLAKLQALESEISRLKSGLVYETKFSIQVQEAVLAKAIFERVLPAQKVLITASGPYAEFKLEGTDQELTESALATAFKALQTELPSHQVEQLARSLKDVTVPQITN